MTKFTRAATYRRVSTEGQEDNTSLNDQLDRVRAYIEARGWVHAGDYTDVFTGTTSSRPGWQRLETDAEAGLLDAVVVRKLDRTGRNVGETAAALDRLDRLGVTVVSVEESIDSTSATGRLMRNILLSFAEHERDTIVARGVSGQRARARSGQLPGGALPFGWSRNQANEPVPDESEREVIRTTVRHLLEEGGTTGSAAALLNALGMTGRKGGSWTHQRVRRTLESRTLIGEVYWGKPTRKYGHHTKLDRDGRPTYGEPVLVLLAHPILDAGTFEQLQAVLALRAYGRKAEALPYPLTRRITCEHGHSMGGVPLTRGARLPLPPQPLGRRRPMRCTARPGRMGRGGGMAADHRTPDRAHACNEGCPGVPAVRGRHR